MQVNFNPNVNFKQQGAPQGSVTQGEAGAQLRGNAGVMMDDGHRAANTNTDFQSNNNIVYVPVQQKKTSGFKESISSVAKFFTNVKEFIKASAKAVGYGAATAGTLLAGFWAFGALPRGFKKGNSLINTFKQPLKSISKQGKIISTVGALGVTTYQLVKGRLIANQRTANIDHQLRTGHRDA